MPERVAVNMPPVAPFQVPPPIASMIEAQEAAPPPEFGTSLGTRPYGYSSFEYDLTPHVKLDGSPNVIAVKVNNNQPNSQSVPSTAP